MAQGEAFAEQMLTAEQERAAREELRAFLAPYHRHASHLLTHTKAGMPIMRPVSTFVEGWTIGTITGDKELKTGHVRRDGKVGYLWVEREGRPGMDWSPRTVWVAGTAEVIDDQDEVYAFLDRRQRAAGAGDTVPHDRSWMRYLIRTRPTYLRAEGFPALLDGKPNQRPIILRTFDDA